MTVSPNASVSQYAGSGVVSNTVTYKENMTPTAYETVAGTRRVQLAEWDEFRGKGSVTVMVTIAHKDVPAYAAALLAAYVEVEDERKREAKAKAERKAQAEGEPQVKTFLSGAFNGLIA